MSKHTDRSGWDRIRDLLHEKDHTLLINGSGELAQVLMNEGLVDDYRIWVHPVVLGAGKRLFRDGQEISGLTLRDVRRTSKGVVILGWMRVEAHGIAYMMDRPSAETFAIALRLRPPPAPGTARSGEPVRLGCGWCHPPGVVARRRT